MKTKYYITLGTIEVPEYLTMLHMPFNTPLKAIKYADKLVKKMNDSVRFGITNTNNK